MKIHQSLLAGLLSHIGLKDLSGFRPADNRARNAEPTGRDAATSTISAPAAPISPSRPARACSGRSRAGSSRPNSSRRPGCGVGWSRRSSRSGPRRWPATWSSARTASRTGRSKQAAVIASEKVPLYGVPLVAARRVNYGRIDPPLCRELFIRNALVEGDWETHHAFFRENRELRDEVEELEHRARRRDILVERRRPLRVLRRPHPGRHRVRPALRRLVEEGPPKPTGSAVVREVDAGQRGAPPPSIRATSRTRSSSTASRFR